MTNQDTSQHKQIRFPIGLVNQIAFVLGIIAFAFAVTSLFSQLFYGHRLSFRQPEQYEVVLKILSLGFFIALFAVQSVRDSFRLLCSALLGFTLVSLFGKLVFYIPENLNSIWGFITSIITLLSTLIFCLALMKGERFDEFIVKAPMSLVVTLLEKAVKKSGQ